MNDNLILFKESIKSKMADNFLSRRHHPAISLAQRIVQRVGPDRIERIIDGKPSSYLVVTEKLIIRIPLDSLTLNRYKVNEIMLKSLIKSSITDFTPRFKQRGNMDGYVYFCEERLKGAAIDVRLSKMDEMVLKAANFITSFHSETAKEITLDEKNTDNLFTGFFNNLAQHLDAEHKEKLGRIEESTKKQLLGKQFVTVWQHGDYKVENVLFDTATWDIKGVIDWDLSKKDGLPLLDILYLLLYKDNLETREGMAEIFKFRFLKLAFLTQEKNIISHYLNTLNLSEDLIKPLLAIFWLHHIAERYQQKLINEMLKPSGWLVENVYNVIELM
jgi:hypothetical protein